MHWLSQHRVGQFQTYFLYFIAFCIPLLPKLVPVSILLLGLLSIYNIVKGYSRVEMPEVSLLLLILFGLHVVGMLYTDNVDRGLFNLEVKLSMMAFPIVFVGFKNLTTEAFHRILRAFLYGTLIAAVVCMLNSTYNVVVLDKRYWFFLTTRFSIIIHPSYFALYLIFAIMSLLYLEWDSIEKGVVRRRLLIALQFIVLSTAVILAGSKSGFIMWMLIVLVLTVLLIRIVKRKWMIVLALAALGSGVGMLFQSLPLLQSRIMNVLKIAQAEQVNPNSGESTALRYLVYSASWQTVTSQPWYGQGTGDFQDVLDVVYEENGYTVASDRHLNAHNLFFQTWIALGIPGLMLVVGLFIIMFTQAIRGMDWVQLGFTVVFLLLSMFESTFNVQSGVVFFSFFAVLLARWNKPGSIESKNDLEVD